MADIFIQRFGDLIKGCITGFDRIVFKGSIRQLMFAAGVQFFLSSRGVLNKDYKDWMMSQSNAIITSADSYARDNCGQGITYLASCNERKEKLAHIRQQELGIETGLIGVWSCLESCSTYRAVYDPHAGFPQLRHTTSRCKHLYFYYDHPEFGFMSIRLQTWFPYGIQIALNGREWLRRSLAQQGCQYLISGNKFLHIDDYALAQRLLDRQLDTRWVETLTSFLPAIFPSMTQTLGDGLSYYWTLWQSEWATDYIFDDPADTTAMMNRLLGHALMTGTGGRVLRYLGHPVYAKEQPHPLANPEVLTRVQTWTDGARIRHWDGQNSVKLYNEQNVLRAEMTMNNPGKYRVHRHAEGQLNAPKRRMQLRKGTADITIRTQVSADINHRFMEQMATVTDDTPVSELLRDIVEPATKKGRRVRALDITGKDRMLLQAIADPAFVVSGITNKQLQQKLGSSSWANGKTGKALSARISRNLRLLRDHGLIQKQPRQRQYILTDKGRKITTALTATLAMSTQQIMEKAA